MKIIFYSEIQNIDTISTKLPSYKETKSRIVSPTELCIRHTRWTDDKLKTLYMDLKAMRLNIMPPETSTLMKKKYKIPVLPSTPYRVQEFKDTLIDQAALCIQETIRGRATQCMVMLCILYYIYYFLWFLFLFILYFFVIRTYLISVEINVFNLFFIETRSK